MMLFSCFMSRVKEPSKEKEEINSREGRKENTLKILSRSDEIVTSIGAVGSDDDVCMCSSERGNSFPCFLS